MKRNILFLLILGLIANVYAAGVQPSYVTLRQGGTIMISGGGFYQTDLQAELRDSYLHLSTDAALFLFPMLALGIELEWDRQFEERANSTFNADEVDEYKTKDLRWGPRAYLFLGGKTSELTPFIKGGPNFASHKVFENDEELEDLTWKTELDLTASAGILLNLAKNVGISAEAEYNFQEGEEIDTDKLFIKFSIRSFLGE